MTTAFRLTVCAGSFEDARRALALLERMTDLPLAEIAGVLLEDPRHAEAAALPHQRLVTFGGGLTTAPSPAALAQRAARDAAAFRTDLERLAAARRAAWRFERRSGALAAALADAEEMILLAHAGALRPSRRVVLIAPPGGAGAGWPLAEALARAMGGHVEELPAPEDAEGREALVARVGRMSAAALVVARGPDAPWPAEALEPLVEAARCPVLLTGTG